MKRSWPFLAWASDAALALIVVKLILSTVTTVLFFFPHSTVYVLLNHSSQARTKWLHWQIFSVFCCAAARSGNRNAGPSAPAARPPAPAILIKSLRDTPVPFFFFSLIKPPQFRCTTDLRLNRHLLHSRPRLFCNPHRRGRPSTSSGQALCYKIPEYAS